MGRPSNRAERRGQIADALMTVMATSGYDGASVAAVARQAGLTPGLVHYHFESKAEILLAAVERLGAQITERTDEAVKGAGKEPWARVEAYVDVALGLGDGADAGLVGAWVMMGTQAASSPAVAELFATVVSQQHEVLADLLRAVLPKGGRKKRARELAAAAVATIEGAFRLSVAAPETLPPGYAAPALKAMLHGAAAA